MRKYEVIYILDSNLGEEEIKAMIEKFTTFIQASCELEKVDEWGKKKFAYPIDKKMEGYYILVNFSAGPEFPALLERQFKITEGVLKYLISKVDD